MERGQRDSSVLVLSCILAFAKVSGSRGFGSCSVEFPPPAENSCGTAWMIDVTNADLVPFRTCERQFRPDGVQANEHITSTSPARLAPNKSVCSQIHIDIADLTYISVHVCKCLNCSLKTKTVLRSRDVWLSSRIHKSGFLSAGHRSRHVFCLWRLLTRTSRTSCHIQADPTRHILLCQTQSAYSENGCFRVWWQHRMCEGYVKCKTLSSPHTCDSLFKTNIQILLPASISENSISFRDLEFSKSGPLISSNLTALEVISADVPQKQEDTYSSFYPCSNCSTLTNHRQKRESECPPGLFGSVCNETCRCRLNKQCYINGSCFSGKCETGWNGASCNQRACPAGKYGITYNKNRCTTSCSCPRDSECDVIHGACPLPSCSNVTFAVGQTYNCFKAACPRRKLLKSKCSDTCHCVHDQICDSVSGLCLNPVCKEAYEPPTCNTRTTEEVGTQLREIILNVAEFTLFIVKFGCLIKLRLLPAIIHSFSVARK